MSETIVKTEFEYALEKKLEESGIRLGNRFYDDDRQFMVNLEDQMTSVKSTDDGASRLVAFIKGDISEDQSGPGWGGMFERRSEIKNGMGVFYHVGTDDPRYKNKPGREVVDTVLKNREFGKSSEMIAIRYSSDPRYIDLENLTSRTKDMIEQKFYEPRESDFILGVEISSDYKLCVEDLLEEENYEGALQLKKGLREIKSRFDGKTAGKDVSISYFIDSIVKLVNTRNENGPN